MVEIQGKASGHRHVTARAAREMRLYLRQEFLRSRGPDAIGTRVVAPRPWLYEVVVTFRLSADEARICIFFDRGNISHIGNCSV